MKTRFLPALLMTTVLLVGAARLGAQTRTTATGNVEDSWREINQRRMFLDQVDKLYKEDASREKAIQASLRASSYDANHDGKLDATEYAAWQKRVRTFVQQQPALMKKFDLDHDGILSDVEWDSAYSEIFETGPAPADAKK